MEFMSVSDTTSVLIEALIKANHWSVQSNNHVIFKYQQESLHEINVAIHDTIEKEEEHSMKLNNQTRIAICHRQ